MKQTKKQTNKANKIKKLCRYCNEKEAQQKGRFCSSFCMSEFYGEPIRDLKLFQ